MRIATVSLTTGDDAVACVSGGYGARIGPNSTSLVVLRYTTSSSSPWSDPSSLTVHTGPPLADSSDDDESAGEVGLFRMERGVGRSEAARRLLSTRSQKDSEHVGEGEQCGCGEEVVWFSPSTEDDRSGGDGEGEAWGRGGREAVGASWAGGSSDRGEKVCLALYQGMSVDVSVVPMPGGVLPPYALRIGMNRAGRAGQGTDERVSPAANRRRP